MSDKPTRLMDDPTFQWETGCDLADLSEQPTNLTNLRARILTSIEELKGPQRLRDDESFKWETRCDLALVGEPNTDLTSLRHRIIHEAAVAGGPPRWIADEDFRWETACHLEDLNLHTEVDLIALRRRVVSGEKGALPVKKSKKKWLIGAGWFWGAAAAAATIVSVGVAYLSPSLQPSIAESRDVAHVGHHVEEVVEPGTTLQVEPTAKVVELEPSPRVSTLDEEAVLVKEVALPTKPLVTVEPEQTAAPTANQAQENTLTKPTNVKENVLLGGEPAAVVAVEGALARETRILAQADAALDAGHHEVALRSFQEYLVQWPQGRFRTEAELGRLQALVLSSQWSTVATTAQQMLNTTEHSGSSDELRRALAESLVQLNRCEEAVDVASSVRGKFSGEIRRACRNRR